MMNRRAFLRSIAGAAVAIPAAAAVAPAIGAALFNPPHPLKYAHATYGMGFPITKAMVDHDRLNIVLLREALATYERMRADIIERHSPEQIRAVRTARNLRRARERR